MSKLFKLLSLFLAIGVVAAACSSDSSDDASTTAAPAETTAAPATTAVELDADGSLLVVDTGGWYKLCCPTSQIAKPEVLGGIYRIRRTDGKPVKDPRGLKLAWEKMSPGKTYVQCFSNNSEAAKLRHWPEFHFETTHACSGKSLLS